jgi:hypothetical protein
MTATFSIDVLDADQKSQIQQYANQVVWTSTRSDDSYHEYLITILSGKRSRTLCSLLPSDAASDSVLGRPPRICHILSNGVHAHQKVTHIS